MRTLAKTIEPSTENSIEDENDDDDFEPTSKFALDIDPETDPKIRLQEKKEIWPIVKPAAESDTTLQLEVSLDLNQVPSHLHEALTEAFEHNISVQIKLRPSKAKK